jgi:hypothetical protein
MKTIACVTGLSLFGSLTILGCGGAGQAGEAVRPKDPTANAALGEATCHDVTGKPGEPLVVDWKPEQRGDLEVAMKEGVAIVAYDCKSIKVLEGCSLEGKYGFLGMTRKEEVVQLANADEVSANLPLSGVKLGGEMQRGSTLDIALVMVGKKKTTWDAPTKEDLKGTCTGATHFVRGATVGAFAMGTGTQGKVRASAELFGAGTQAASSSQKSVQNKDGDVGDCQKASPDSDKAPSQCGAPIRLMLQPIAASKVAEAKDPPKAPPSEKPSLATIEGAEACPTGLVLSNGKCTTAAAAPTHQCKANDVADCTAQCDKSHPGSCAELGTFYANKNDYSKAIPALTKGCDGGALAGCASLGIMYYAGFGIKTDATKAVSLFQKSCDGGEAIGCRELGRNTQFGTGGLGKDEKRAFSLYQRACEGGDFTGCAFVGSLYMSGIGTDKNVPKGVEFNRRACDGGHAASCAETASVYESGAAGVGKNEILAKMLYQRGCNSAKPGFEHACGGLGRMEWTKNPEAQTTKMVIERACAFRDPMSCALLKVGYGDKRAVFADANRTTENMTRCNTGDARSCAILGLLQSATQAPQVGKPQVTRACSMGDAFGCALAKKMP